MENSSWLSLDWFSISRLESFDWENPIWFYAIPLIPILFILRWLIINRFRQKLPIALTKTELKSDPISLLRFIPGIFFILSLLLIIIGMARPQTTNEQTEQWSEGIDIMLTVDISSPCKSKTSDQTDWKPPKRWQEILFQADSRIG